MKAIEYRIKGIKCDNPYCDYRDDNVKYEDYPLWLNKPCPKCGTNLLTEEDLIATRRFIRAVNIINWIMTPFMLFCKNAKRVKYSVEMNGTGKIKLRRMD